MRDRYPLNFERFIPLLNGLYIIYLKVEALTKQIEHQIREQKKDQYTIKYVDKNLNSNSFAQIFGKKDRTIVYIKLMIKDGNWEEYIDSITKSIDIFLHEDSVQKPIYIREFFTMHTYYNIKKLIRIKSEKEVNWNKYSKSDYLLSYNRYTIYMGCHQYNKHTALILFHHTPAKSAQILINEYHQKVSEGWILNPPFNKSKPHLKID